MTFSKSFGDVDATIRALKTAEINALIARYQADLECRNYIDSVIHAYTSLCILVKEKQINLASIEAKKVLLTSMTIKFQHGREILLNVLKLSNEIESAKLNVRLSEISYTNEMRLLKTLCAFTNTALDLQFDLPQMSSELPVDAYDLQLRVAYLQLTNLRITLNGVRRSQFLPTLSLSLSESYDIDENSSSFDAGIGLSYSVLDIFDRRNSIREYEGSIASQIESISNTIRIFEDARTSFDTKLQAAYDEVALMEQQLEIEKGLEELYRYQYETDQME
jgi:outer membrane protein TolC